MEGAPIKRFINIAMLVFTALIIIKCANQLPPSGGDVDRIPPEVVYAYPQTGTTNFADNRLIIEFSEYVDRRSVQDAVFISPAVEGGIEYDWGGQELEIIFEEPLKENTTYTVTIGTDVKDINNNNNMAEAFTIAFSTGDEIDKGSISGLILDDAAAGALIYAYVVDSDTLNPLEDKPGYISQVGPKGKYAIPGLGEGTYRLFAVKDDLRNLIYEIEDDSYGAPHKEILITEDDTTFTGLNFRLTKEDTSKPFISNVTMTDRYHFYVEFTEHIDSSKIAADDFYIYDSTNNIRYGFAYLYAGNKGGDKLYLALGDTLAEPDNIYLINETLTDMRGNRTGAQSYPVAYNESPDTSAPKVIKTETEYDRKVDFENPWLLFRFDDGFDTTLAKQGIVLTDLKDNEIGSDISFPDDGSFLIESNSDLKPNAGYKVDIELANIVDAAGNSADTLYRYEFTTVNELDFSGLSGRVNAAAGNDVYVVINKADKESNTYKTKSVNNSFNFPRVVPGKYVIWSFIDADSSGNYSYGSIMPFEPSDKFVVYPDTVNLRARWPVGDVTIDYD